MPGPIVHLIVQQSLSRELRAVVNGAECAQILEAEPCSPYAAFGSMGPDFLFFSMKEYGPEAAALTNAIFAIYDAFEPLIVFYNRTIVPVVTAIEDALRRLDEAAFQGLFGNIKATFDLLSTTALTAAGVALNEQVDLFHLVFPRAQKGAPERDWFWFDILHARRTGQFTTELWRRAGSDPDLQRYAIGYASHVATDVVGHPFVNAITGGP